jgi:hypothetical protein
MAFGKLPTGICPHCDTTLKHVIVEKINIVEGVTPKWNGVSFVCSHCHAILSVGLDPFALNADLVDEILKALGRMR